VPRGRRCALPARHGEPSILKYASDEQRPWRGCSGVRMPSNFRTPPWAIRSQCQRLRRVGKGIGWQLKQLREKAERCARAGSFVRFRPNVGADQGRLVHAAGGLCTPREACARTGRLVHAAGGLCAFGERRARLTRNARPIRSELLHARRSRSAAAALPRRAVVSIRVTLGH
jgi:hypothetical protein